MTEQHAAAQSAPPLAHRVNCPSPYFNCARTSQEGYLRERINAERQRLGLPIPPR